MPDYSDPMFLGDLVISRRFSLPGCEAPVLRWYQQQWLAWDGAKYVALSEDFVSAAVWEILDREFEAEFEERMKGRLDPDKPAPKKLTVSRSRVAETLAAVRSKVFIPDQVPMPCWLDGPYKDHDPRDFVALANGILWLPTVDADEPPKIIRHNPLWFSSSCLAAVYNPFAQSKRLTDFLASSVRDDDKIAMLQEWFGYCITNDTSYQKFMLMVGEGANGKSVVCAMLTALLGGDNVSHVPLESFGSTFGLVGTLGKLANIAAEIGDLDRVAEGHLKAFTAGDRMEFNRKHKSSVYAVPTARLMLSTNNRPRFADRSNGIWRRLLLLNMNHKVPERDRIPGMDQASFWRSESAAILNWALQGLADLRRYKRFTIPAESVEALEDYKQESNPVREFLTENYRYTGNSHDWAPTSCMYDLYKKWAEAGGYSPVNVRNFGKEIPRLWPESERVQRGGREERFWAYTKILRVSSAVQEFDLNGFT